MINSDDIIIIILPVGAATTTFRGALKHEQQERLCPRISVSHLSRSS